MADETHRLIYADTAHYMLLEGYDIRDVPTAADVQPVKRGKWIENAGYGGWGDTIYQCSECGSERTCETGISIDWNFCPNCGADMRE